MKRKWKVKFPLTSYMSPMTYIIGETPMETKEEQALWFYNKSREHDGLPPLRELPKGVKFEELF